MIDHPRPELEAVRRIVEQIAKGLRAFHRQEMLHQDLRPQNIMIDPSGTVKIIDFGSVSVAGWPKRAPVKAPGCSHGGLHRAGVLPRRSGQRALGSVFPRRHRLPDAGRQAAVRNCGGQDAHYSGAAQARLSADRRASPRHPTWVDGALKKALHPDPGRRHAEVSELVHDLRHANTALLGRAHPPLIERNPLAFWKGVSLLLATVVLAMIALWPRH